MRPRKSIGNYCSTPGQTASVTFLSRHCRRITECDSFTEHTVVNADSDAYGQPRDALSNPAFRGWLRGSQRNRLTVDEYFSALQGKSCSLVIFPCQGPLWFPEICDYLAAWAATRNRLKLRSFRCIQDCARRIAGRHLAPRPQNFGYTHWLHGEIRHGKNEGSASCQAQC